MFEAITSEWTIVDWAFIIWMSFSLILGLLRGFIAEMLSLIGWILAFVIGFEYGEQVGKLIPLPTNESTVVFIVGFIITLIASLIIWSIAKTMLKFAVGHGWIDHLLGFFFGLVRGFLVSALVVSFVSIIFPLPQQDWWKKSKYHKFLERSALEVKALVPAKWGERMQLDIEKIKAKVPSTLPTIADSLPSSVKSGIADQVKEQTINSLIPKKNIENNSNPSIVNEN